MYSELEFVNDFIRAYSSYNRSDRLQSAIKLCYQTYLNSSRAHLGALLVGRIVKPVMPAVNSPIPPMVGIGDIERFNFGTTGDRSSGSALWNKYWSIPLNDAWLLGGIHARLPFYLASPRTKENLVDSKYGFTVTGRELIGLTTFGYKLNNNTSLGEVFECADSSKATMATFASYETTFQTVKKQPDYWKKLVA